GARRGWGVSAGTEDAVLWRSSRCGEGSLREHVVDCDARRGRAAAGVGTARGGGRAPETILSYFFAPGAPSAPPSALPRKSVRPSGSVRSRPLARSDPSFD